MATRASQQPTSGLTLTVKPAQRLLKKENPLTAKNPPTNLGASTLTVA